jgi:hypothetical protein
MIFRIVFWDVHGSTSQKTILNITGKLFQSKKLRNLGMKKDELVMGGQALDLDNLVTNKQPAEDADDMDIPEEKDVEETANLSAKRRKQDIQ